MNNENSSTIRIKLILKYHFKLRKNIGFMLDLKEELYRKSFLNVSYMNALNVISVEGNEPTFQ